MTEEALLKAILCDPEDDAPRLIYADWLDGEGHSDRAEFIRVQIGLEGIEEPAVHAAHSDPSCEGCRLIAREGELMPDYPLPTNFVQEYRRGFIHSVECTAEDWLAHGDEILLSQPVREVTLSTWPLASDIGGVPQWGAGFNENVRLLLVARWPQIKPECWHLPTLRPDEITDLVNETLRHTGPAPWEEVHGRHTVHHVIRTNPPDTTC